VSEINPADVSVGGGSPNLSDEFSRETSDVETPSPTRKPEREGLPSGYRMRADAHYVDQLSTPRGSGESQRNRRGAVATPDESREAREAREANDARDRRETRDLRTDRLLSQLGEDLATVESSVATLTSGASPTARRVMLDVLRAHTWRAAWLVRAQTLADGPVRSTVRARPIGGVLSRLREGFAAECRLNSLALHVHVPDWNAAVAVDEQELMTGITGAIVSTIGLLGDSDGATVKVTATAAGGELRTVEVSQDEAIVPAAVAGRFFDPVWADRPGGFVAGFGAWTARLVAQRHGGDAVLVAGDRRGSTLRLTFERAI
jgi:hypothetical protein